MPTPFGKYQLRERIGSGGMAEVFRAVSFGAEGFSRPVAIKRMKNSISADEDFADLFVTEARLASQLIHPNVVQTYDFDRDDQGRLILVMEFIDGVNLRQLLHSGPIPIAASVYIAVEVLRALDYAHELVDAGERRITVIHRDVSPHNIMLSWLGCIKVVDFGIAKAIEKSLVSRSGSLKGKVSYMSPEQVRGYNLDGRSDLFALGIVLHEILSGRRLFVAKSESATLSMLLSRPIPLPSAINSEVPADLDAVVMQLLARNRDSRYTRARDAMNALLRCSAVSRGREQLESIVRTRFPDRIPKRITRLSPTPPQEIPDSDHHTCHSSLSSKIHSATISVPAIPSNSLPNPIPEQHTVPSVQSPTLTALAEKDTTSRSQIHQVATSSTHAPSHTGKAPPIGKSIGVITTGVVVALGLLFAPTPKNHRPQHLELVSVSQPAALPTSQTTLPSAPHDSAPISPTAAKNLPNSKSPSEKTSNESTLMIRVQPWALIKVDGIDYGQTPQTIKLPSGKHQIELTNSVLDREETLSLQLKPGQTRIVAQKWLTVVPNRSP